jgi:hypothetical protein
LSSGYLLILKEIGGYEENFRGALKYLKIVMDTGG